MPRQHTKLWGLKKLRKIIRGFPASAGRIATLAPFKVYDSPAQFQRVHAQSQPRLLVRTDERGRFYDRLIWHLMPRFDFYFASKGLSRVLRGERSFRKKLQKTVVPGARNARFIVHPTRLIGEVDWVGEIEFGRFLFSKRNRIRLMLGRQRQSPSKHLRGSFFMYGSSILEFEWKNNHLVLVDPLSQHRLEGIHSLVTNIELFLREAFRQKQLKLERHRTVVRFNTWIDDPTTPEFYDLQEYREPQAP